MHIFKHVDPENLSLVAKSLLQQDYNPGDVIAHQGTPSRGLYFLISGKAEWVYEDDKGNADRIAVVGEGTVIGAWESLHGKPWQSSFKATTTVSVALWPRPASTSFILDHPGVLEALKIHAKTQRLSSDLRFKWLNEEESIFALTRKHPIELVKSFFLPVLLAIVGVMLLGSNPFGESFPSGWLSTGMFLLSGALAIWRWIDWGNDYNVVTNRRAIALEKVIGIYDNRQETPLQWVLSVSVATGPLGRVLGYGDVIIRTYTGQLIFQNTVHPEDFASILEEQWERYKRTRNLTDREEMVQTLHEHLGTDDTQPVGVIQAMPEELLEPQRSTPSRWGLRMRYQNGDVITYRKHWAILAHAIALPTFFLFTVITGVVARLAGLFDALPLGTAALFSGGLVFTLLLWWLYRYIDWANDIYQITPTHIVDISKKPLAREIRMIAPLDNILGTEIDRQGFFGVMLNFGAVIANVGAAQFTFYGVPDPATVQQDIVFAQDELLKRQAETERVQRRDEVVEWLSTYHQEIVNKDELEKGTENQ
jgi:CRP-like cAMP-binding protein